MGNRYLKAILAAAVPLVAAVNSAIVTGEVNAPEVALALTGFVAAGLVAVFRNKEEGFLSATKFIVAAAVPLVSAAIQWGVTQQFNTAEWATLVTGFLTALLVYFSSNSDDSDTSTGGNGTMAGGVGNRF